MNLLSQPVARIQTSSKSPRSMMQTLIRSMLSTRLCVRGPW